MKSISAIIILVLLVICFLRWISPHIDQVITYQRSRKKTRIQQAEKFLDTLTVAQIMSINNYFQHGSTTFGMVTLLGDENFFLISQNSGIAETLRNNPELFNRAATRKLTRRL